MMRSTVFRRGSLVLVLLAALLVAAFGYQLLEARSGPNRAAAAVGVRITMAVNGQKQGAFKGDDFNTTKGSAGLINVLAYSAEITSPRDPATGQATGRRTWKPIVITHVMGGSTPEFFAATATNENLTKVVINFYRVTNKGTETNYFRVTLVDATVSDVHDYTSGQDVLEDDSFFFRKITIEDLVAKTTFEDNFTTNLT
jgi:type VI secretion system secreted protein Hcp